LRLDSSVSLARSKQDDAHADECDERADDVPTIGLNTLDEPTQATAIAT